MQASEVEFAFDFKMDQGRINAILSAFDSSLFGLSPFFFLDSEK
jgi:hypothetical protein